MSFYGLGGPRGDTTQIDSFRRQAERVAEQSQYDIPNLLEARKARDSVIAPEAPKRTSSFVIASVGLAAVALFGTALLFRGSPNLAGLVMVVGSTVVVAGLASLRRVAMNDFRKEVEKFQSLSEARAEEVQYWEGVVDQERLSRSAKIVRGIYEKEGYPLDAWPLMDLSPSAFSLAREELFPAKARTMGRGGLVTHLRKNACRMEKLSHKADQLFQTWQGAERPFSGSDLKTAATLETLEQEYGVVKEAYLSAIRALPNSSLSDAKVQPLIDKHLTKVQSAIVPIILLIAERNSCPQHKK